MPMSGSLKKGLGGTEQGWGDYRKFAGDSQRKRGDMILCSVEGKNKEKVKVVIFKGGWKSKDRNKKYNHQKNRKP